MNVFKTIAFHVMRKCKHNHFLCNHVPLAWTDIKGQHVPQVFHLPSSVAISIERSHNGCILNNCFIFKHLYGHTSIRTVFIYCVHISMDVHGYVCMSVCCCSHLSDEADVDFNMISMDEVISTGVKETWV